MNKRMLALCSVFVLVLVVIIVCGASSISNDRQEVAETLRIEQERIKQQEWEADALMRAEAERQAQARQIAIQQQKDDEVQREKELVSMLPEYIVMFRVMQIHNNRRYGDVLITSLSRATSMEKREQIAHTICKQEYLDDICLYSTLDAYEANMSALYLKSHPDALEIGFLGFISGESTDYKFVAGEVLFPSTTENSK